jgi:hypothetical protein
MLSCKKMKIFVESEVLDLHGLTVSGLRERKQTYITQWHSIGKKALKIITGSGPAFGWQLSQDYPICIYLERKGWKSTSGWINSFFYVKG